MGAGVLIVAAAFRLWNLSWPSTTVWDEHYYVFDAAAYLGGGFGVPVGTHPPLVRIASEGSWVHPPLAKWLIALLGEGPFGMHPFGTRFPSALFGVLGVLAVYLLARTLWESMWWAGLAALLLAVDGLHVVQSRLAMLDIFVTTFVTLGALFLAMDRAQAEHGGSSRNGRIERWFGSRLRLFAGLSFGAAVASKWSGAPALAFGTIFCAWWVIRKERPRLRAAGRLIASFIVAPVVVYVISYGAFWYQHGPDVGDFVKLQVAMYQEQSDHPQIQFENSSPISWPLLLHPIRYYPGPGQLPGDLPQNRGEILLVGNPVVFWGFLALLPAWLIGMRRRRGWRDALILGGYVAMYGPWLLAGRTQFLYYMLPAVPFMCLGIVAALRRLGPYASAAGISIAVLALVVGLAFAPLWTGVPAPAWWVDHFRWIGSWR